MADEHDEVLMRIGVEWLVQYARFLRRSPGVLAALLDRPAEFEMIPVPRTLLNQLAMPGLIGSGNLGCGPDASLEHLLGRGAGTPHATGAGESGRPENCQVDPGPLALVREFAAGLEAGDLPRIMSLFAEQFIDPNGRKRPEIQSDLGALIGRTEAGRKLCLAAIAQTSRSPRDATLRAEARWEGYEAEGEAGHREDFALEFLLEQDEAGLWKIASQMSL